MKVLKRAGVLSIVLLLLLALLPTGALAADKQAADQKRVVTVAYPQQKYLSEIDVNGGYSGYSYEYLSKIAEFANWKLEFITYPDMPLNDQLVTGLEMVASGQADLIGAMLQNPALAQRYLYPQRNYGAVYTTLEALDTNLTISVTNYMQKEPLRIAVLETATTRNAELDTFLKAMNITCEYITCATVDAQLEALRSNTADLMLNVSLTFLPNLKIVAQFAPRPYYFVSGPGNEDLVAELDAAIEKINLTDPYFETRLQDQYFQNTVADFSLSEGEAQFVGANGTLGVLVLPRYAPFAFLNEEEQLCGISVAILDEIGSAAGFTLDYHVLEPGESLSEEMAGGAYSIVIGPPHSQTFAEANSLVLSQSYLETSLTMFIRKSAEEIPENQRVLALMRDGADPIAYGYKEIKYYDTIEQCLEAVSRGEADYGYASRYLIDFYTEESSHPNLKFLNLSGYNREIGFYVPSGEAVELLSILNKYVRAMPAKDVHSYLAQALNQRDTGGLSDFIRQNPLTATAIAAVGISLFILTIMLAIYSRANQKRNEKLRQAYAAKSDFLSRMSHDMRTPMNGIIGLTGLSLDMEQVPPELVENLRKIDESARFLLSLINDTLDMNKIESSKIVLSPEATDLRAFYDQVVDIAKISADQKKVCLNVLRSDDAVPAVWMDKVRVQQILFNVISNAIKFTPEGGTVALCSKCRQGGDARLQVSFTVTDTGVGISEAFLPRIFEPFEQEDTAAALNYTGTGLGLAIVKNLVDLMGGTIAVTSKKGVGTQFSIALTFDIAASQAAPEPAKAVSQAVLQGKRILLCEDHPLNAQIATKLLEKKGMLVERAENGQAAVTQFTLSAPGYYDGILMDIRMPVMDGLTAAKVIRGITREDALTVPIIAMTANAFDEDVQKSMEAGMNAHLAKPIEPVKLYDTLAHFLESQPR